MARRVLLLTTVGVLLGLAALPGVAVAGHAWSVNGRAVHWASTTNPVRIDLGDNLDDPVWKDKLYIPTLVWSIYPTGPGQLGLSPFMRVAAQAGGLASNEVEMHDGFYGRNGWVGQATLNSIDSQGHIRDATVQLNQSYSLSESQKQATINHEVGHTLGLAHQEGTVMCPILCGISNPVQHDWDVVTYVNAHTDSYDTPTLSLQAPQEPGETTTDRDGPRALVYVTRLRNGDVRILVRDFISAEAATAAARR
jgi:hypothetical protein